MDLLAKFNLEKLSHSKQIMFAIFCAEQVFHLVKQEHREVCKKALNSSKSFLEGKVTKEECRVAAAAVNTAIATYTTNTIVTYAAAHAATYATTFAAYAAANTANAAHAAAYAAAYAANAVGYAAADAAVADAATFVAYAAAANTDRQKTIREQWVLYEQLLNGDIIFEEAVLK